MKNLTELEQKILHYDSQYRSGNPEISDKQFDQLIDQLKKEKPESEILKKGVISQKVNRKQKLPTPMFSLEKKKSIEEINQWIDSIDSNYEMLIITPKYDGISLCVNHIESECYTRGNGEEGQRSDSHFSRISPSLTRIVSKISFGEAIMRKSTFQKKYKGEYKSARNLVAGLFNRDISSEMLSDCIYVAYGTDLQENKNIQLESINSAYNKRSQVPYKEVRQGQITEKLLNDLYEKWLTDTDFNLDGLVIEINDFGKREELGRLDNGNPKYAIAYKNPEWSGKHITIVKSIEFNISKQGKIKPVIIIEPADIDGVIVERITGYNMAYMIDNEIATGSEIEIVRSGDVIPKHIKTISFKENELIDMIDNITECPCCGNVTRWDETMTEIVCTNEKCPDVIKSKIEHFFVTVGVEEFARPSINNLYDNGFNTIEKILTINKNEFAQLEGWGEKSANMILGQFKTLFTVGVPFARLLHALDLFQGVIGEKTAQLIIDEMEIRELGVPLSISELIKIKGVAEKTAKVFIEGYNSFDYSTNYVKISMFCNKREEKKEGSLSEQRICFTGIRDGRLEILIKEKGGEIVSGVSKKTTMLIAKDYSPETMSSIKAKKAVDLGVDIVSIEEFYNERLK
jgi:DNA ligase (NAD+)